MASLSQARSLRLFQAFCSLCVCCTLHKPVTAINTDSLISAVSPSYAYSNYGYPYQTPRNSYSSYSYYSNPSSYSYSASNTASTSPYKMNVRMSPAMNASTNSQGFKGLEGFYGVYRYLINAWSQGTGEGGSRSPTAAEKLQWQNLMKGYMLELNGLEKEYWAGKNTYVYKYNVQQVKAWINSTAVKFCRFAIRFLRGVVKAGRFNACGGKLYGESKEAVAARDGIEMQIRQVEKMMIEQYGGGGAGYFLEKYWWTVVIGVLVLIAVGLSFAMACGGNKPRRVNNRGSTVVGKVNNKYTSTGWNNANKNTTIVQKNVSGGYPNRNTNANAPTIVIPNAPTVNQAFNYGQQPNTNMNRGHVLVAGQPILQPAQVTNQQTTVQTVQTYGSVARM